MYDLICSNENDRKARKRAKNLFFARYVGSEFFNFAYSVERATLDDCVKDVMRKKLTPEDAKSIFEFATELGLVSKEYVELNFWRHICHTN